MTVDPKRGEIPLAEATLSEHEFLVYKYKLPPHLQFGFSTFMGMTERQVERFSRLDIFVVHSEAFPKFMKYLERFGNQSFFC